jgi:hypothetical protein
MPRCCFEGEEPLTSTLKIRTEVTIHDECICSDRSGWSARTLWPRQSGTEGLSRVRGGEDPGIRPIGPIRPIRPIRLSHSPEQVHGPRLGELRRTQAIHEVPATYLTTLLKQLENGIHPSKSAFYPFG